MAFDNILIDDFCRVLPKSPSGLGIINHTSSTCSLLNFVLFYLNLLVAYLPTVFGISEISAVFRVFCFILQSSEHFQLSYGIQGLPIRPQTNDLEHNYLLVQSTIR